MLIKNLRYGFRMMRSTPVFTAAVILTMALAIAANTTIFSVLNAVLLRPLPYENPKGLVLTFGELRKRGVTDWPSSNANLLDLRSGAKTRVSPRFSQLAQFLTKMMARRSRFARLP